MKQYPGMLTTRAALLGVLLCCHLAAQNTSSSLRITPGFDLTAIDRTVDPCDDFYRFACGTWVKNNPIPSDQASWGRFDELAERNREILHQILEKAAIAVTRDANTQKIGDYYKSCMDEKDISAKGLAPLQPELDRINAMTNTTDLSEEVARLHRIGVDVLFSFSSGQDFKDSNAVIGQADQGGLGLPEKDYYFRAGTGGLSTSRGGDCKSGETLHRTGRWPHS
jgi:putative endopeptidase